MFFENLLLKSENRTSRLNEAPIFQLLSKVLLLLRPKDRLSIALTCRRWAEVTSASYMLEDVRLRIKDSQLKCAGNILLKSRRHYQFLEIWCE